MHCREPGGENLSPNTQPDISSSKSGQSPSSYVCFWIYGYITLEQDIYILSPDMKLNNMASKHKTPHPNKDMQGQRLVFRVPNYKPKSSACGSEESPTVYHSRRSHRKSRAGCVNCKQRRVKCDEAKPHCQRCQKHGVNCDYTGKPTRPKTNNNIVSEFIKTTPELMTMDCLASSVSLMMVSDKLNELLRSTHGLPKSLIDDSAMDRTIQALRHFHIGPAFSNESPTSVRIVMGKMVDLAFETPFLMHAIIGAATTHLCTLLPDNKAYRLAEAYHWQQTINLYTNEVSMPTRQNMDKLYSTCMMISMHSFLMEKFDPRASFVFSTDPASLNWLRIQGGLRYLLAETSNWLPESMWWSVFMESRDPNIDFDDKRCGRVGLDPDLADLCSITHESTVESCVLLWPLRMLMGLLSLERGTGSFQKYNTWMGRIEGPFLECLGRKEGPALVLLAWWLGLMCYVEEWWVGMRVRSECTAICMFLEDVEDPLVLRLLEFPASCCGYLLRHEQERVQLEVDRLGYVALDS